MAKWHINVFALVCVLLQTLVLGFKIDQSCIQQGIEDLVRDAMRSAFEMAASARDRIDANPLDRDTAELVGFLFAKQNASPAQLRTSGQLAKTLNVLRNIYNNFRIEIGSGNVPNDDVVSLFLKLRTDDGNFAKQLLQVIYCNHDRFVLHDASKKIYQDQSRDEDHCTVLVLMATGNGIYIRHDAQQCKGGGLMDKVALAVSWNPHSAESYYGVPAQDHPTQIQICPWFIDWLKNREFKLARDVFRTNIGRLVIKGAVSDRFGLRQIGMFDESVPEQFD
jgi:hypothetical protein